MKIYKTAINRNSSLEVITEDNRLYIVHFYSCGLDSNSKPKSTYIGRIDPNRFIPSGRLMRNVSKELIFKIRNLTKIK